MIKIYSKILIIVIIVTVFLVAVFFGLKSMRQHKTTTDSQTALKAEKPIPVKTVKVQYGIINERIGTECIARESESIELNTGIAGQVTKINANIGDTVQKGQVLIEFDQSLYQSKLSVSKKVLADFSHQIYEIAPFVKRCKVELAKKNSVISFTECLRVTKEASAFKLHKANAEAELLNIKNIINSTYIKAPFDGLVTDSFVKNGIFLPAYKTLMNIVKTDPVLMECALSEDKLPSINKRQFAEITFTSRMGSSFKGEVHMIKPIIDDTKRTFTALIKVNNIDNKIMLGAHGIVHLINNKNALRVPSTTLLNQNGNTANIFTVNENNTAHLKTITIGGYADGYTEVVNGLSENDEIVIVGQTFLKNNSQILIHNKDNNSIDDITSTTEIN